MNKVKNIYLFTAEELKVSMKVADYCTGLVLEMENGEWYAHGSTDPLAPFSKFTPNF